MKKKVLIFISLITIFIVSITSANAISKFEDEDYLERNFSKVELATKLQNKIKKYYEIKNTYNDIYPSYYGGIYISDDAENLILQVIKENIPEINSDEYNFYKEIIEMDNSIKIEYVENSFNDLNVVNNYISDNLMSTGNVSLTYLDIMNNAVGVALINNNIMKQNEVIRIISNLENLSKKYNLIKFYKAEVYTTSTNINAGGKIYRNTTNSNDYCSMGMRVKYNGNNGYLTAGHCTKNHLTFPSGTIQVTNFANNQYYDYGFVKTNFSYTPTNKLAFTTTNITKLGLVNYSPAITTNMSISKAGARTYYTSGSVTGLNQTANYDLDGDGIGDILIKGLIKSNLYQGGGDSGGVVMIPRTDSNGGAIGIGLLSGGINLGYEMYFTALVDLPSSLQNRY